MPDNLFKIDEASLTVAPENWSNMGGEAPPGFFASITGGFMHQRAGQAGAYTATVEDLNTQNEKEVELTGRKLKPVFNIFGVGGHLEGRLFQSIMNKTAPFPGYDDRYETRSEGERAFREAIAYNTKLMQEAKAENSKVKSYGELNQAALTKLRDESFVDPRVDWAGFIGQYVGASAALFNFRTNPWAPLEAASLAFGGIGGNSLLRVGSLGVVGAGLAIAPQPGASETKKLAGIPDDQRDLAFDAMIGFAGGAFGGLIGEMLVGSAGRAMMNERFAWMSAARRQQTVGTRFADLPELPVEPPPVPVPEGPPPPGPDVAALAAKPAKPGAVARVAETPPSDVLGATEGSLQGYQHNLSRGERVAASILDRAPTKAAKVRLAEDLDHMARQMDVLGVEPQDTIPPTRPLSPSATIMPEVRSWLGPTVGDPPKLSTALERAARAHDWRVEDVARELDQETWAKVDRIRKELSQRERELAEIIQFHADSRSGKTEALDTRLAKLSKELTAAKTDASKQRIMEEIQATQGYHEQLKQTRPAGEGPKPPTKGLDIQRYVEAVERMRKIWDEVVPLRDRSIARANGLWEEHVRDRHLYYDTALGSTHEERIDMEWRWPQGKRPKSLAKNPYEINVLKGPSKEQIYAERQLELPQQKDPLALEGAKPNETPAETAIRVDTLTREIQEETQNPALIKAFQDVLAQIEKGPSMQVARGVSTPIVKAGQATAVYPKGTVRTGNTGTYIVGFTHTSGEVRLLDNSVITVSKMGGDLFHGKDIIDASAVRAFKQPGETAWTTVIHQNAQPVPTPSLPSGMTHEALINHPGFEIDGKPVTLKQALEDLVGEKEALARFNACSVEP